MKKRTCKYCGEKYLPKYNTVEPCPRYECRVKAADKVLQKVYKAKKVEAKKKLLTYSQRMQIVKVVFQKWVRIRDKDLPCISCGATASSVWDGGHYKKAEVYSGVIFNEFNCHRQCGKCNRYLGGNELNYRVGLIKKIGLANVDELELIANQTRTKKYTVDELERIFNTYKNKIKQHGNI